MYTTALLSAVRFEWRSQCFQGDFRQEVSRLTFSSAPTSCTSPYSCSPSLWIHGRGREQGPRGGKEGGKEDRGGSGGDWLRGGCYWFGGWWGDTLGCAGLEISVVCFCSFQDRRGLELGLEFSLGAVGVEIVGLGSGDLAASQPQQEASITWKKKYSWTLNN